MKIPKTIAIVEDDPEIRRLVTALLEREGFGVISYADGAALDEALPRKKPDLLVLDLMLPGEDGLSICRRLRAESGLPILMLSAKGDDIDRIVGLEMGADDYLPKPFTPRELVARVRALLRRSDLNGVTPKRNRLAFESFIADFDRRALYQDGTQVVLTSAEFELLECFLRRPGRVLSRDQLLDWVHGRDTGVFDRSVDMAISRLRGKLGDDQAHAKRLIATVRNAGYVFTGTVTLC